MGAIDFSVGSPPYENFWMSSIEKLRWSLFQVTRKFLGEAMMLRCRKQKCERSFTLKKQWGGLLTFVLMAVLSLSALGQQAFAQAPAEDSGQAAAQTPGTAPSTPAPLPTPSMTAPLSTAAPPHTFSAGPFGTVAITGILSGMGAVQSNWITGDKSTHWDLSNGQIFLQKTSGWFQFYLQGGAYNLPALGFPIVGTVDTVKNLYGPLPIA